jgi:hypothetical protein
MKGIIYKRIINIDYQNIDLNFLIKLCKDLKVIKNNLFGEQALDKIFELDEIKITKGGETSIIKFTDIGKMDVDNNTDIDSDTESIMSDISINNNYNQSYE